MNLRALEFKGFFYFQHALSLSLATVACNCMHFRLIIKYETVDYFHSTPPSHHHHHHYLLGIFSVNLVYNDIEVEDIPVFVVG